MYTSFNSSSSNSGYNYLVANGYLDAQHKAIVNANRSTSYGTFHKIGERETNRISEDFVWYTKEMQALCFKVLSNKISDDASDHYPVMADLKFN